MTTREILDKILLQYFCCCMPLTAGCQAIGSLEWLATLYLSCRYSDLENPHCNRARLSKISCNMIFYNILSFIVSAAIMSGISKRCREYFLPWLLVKTIEYAVFTVIMIHELQSSFVMEVSILYLIALVILFIVMFWYSWLSIFSLYFRMGNSDYLKPDRNSYQLQQEMV